MIFMIMQKGEAMNAQKQSFPTHSFYTQWLHGVLLLAPIFLLACVAFLFYYPSLHYSFQFDDVANIHKVFSIRFLTLKEAWFSSQRWIAFWLNAVSYSFSGFNPYYFRLFNVLFHITTGVLVYFFVYLTQSSKAGLSQVFNRRMLLFTYCVAALFLLHPVQTQTVSYVIQGRMEGLATLFVFAVCITYILAARAKNISIKMVWYSMMFVLAALSCGTKEITIVAPLLVLCTDWFFISKGDWQSLKKRLPIIAALTVLIVGLYMYFLKPGFFLKLFGLKMEARSNIGNLLTEKPGEKILPLHFLISQFKVILHYIVMYFWPFNISVEYDWKLVSHFFALDCIAPLCVLLALASWIGYRLYCNKTDELSFYALWFAIAVAPRSSIIPSSELLADYKTYLASFGILAIIGMGIVYIIDYYLSHVHERTRIMLAYLAASLLCVPVGFLTTHRNMVWRSNEEFWANIVENAPGKARAYNNLGVALSEKGKIQEAIPLYKKAIAMDRNYPDPCNNLAVAYSLTGKTNLAIETLKHAIKLYPYSPETYNNLASLLISQKKFDEAEKFLGMALQLRSHYGKAYYNLGKIYLEKGDKEKAFENLKLACTKADFDNEAGFLAYGNAALHTQHYDDAIFAYEKLFAAKPGSMEILLKLSQAYHFAGQTERAIPLLQKVVKADAKNIGAWYNLGEAYMEIHEYQNALDSFVKIQNLNAHIPQASYRMISCLYHLNRVSEAAELMQHFLADASVPQDLKELAQKTFINKTIGS